MIAKKPTKRGDGGSSFADLVDYICREEEDNPEDIIDDEYTERLRNLFAKIRGNLEQATRNNEQAKASLREINISSDFNGSTWRINLERIRDVVDAIKRRFNGDQRRGLDADSRSGREPGGDTLNGTITGYIRQLAVIRHNLRAASRNLGDARGYLNQARPLDREFLNRARANRADIERVVRSINQQLVQNLSALEDSEPGEARRERVNGVNVQYNTMSLETASLEMEQVASKNPRVKDAVYHTIISWPSGEHPTDEQAFESALAALKALGMDEHQYVFAVHRDTSHAHVHIAVNKVHPENYKCGDIHHDYIKLDRAMREMELKLGFSHDEGPMKVYYDENRVPFIDWASKADKDNNKPEGAADMEAHTGEESFFTFLSDKPKKAILAALKRENVVWQEIHLILAQYNAEIKMKGQGLAIFDKGNPDMTPIKASSVHEKLSKGRLEKLLGPYQESQMQDVKSKDHYKKPKRDPDEREQRKQERAEARALLKERYLAYKASKPVFVYENTSKAKALYAAVLKQSKERRADVKKNIPDVRARKAAYSMITIQAMQERERIKIQLQVERDHRLREKENVMSWQRWVEAQAAAGDEVALAQLRGWRYKEQRAKHEIDGAAIAGIHSLSRAVVIDEPNMVWSAKKNGDVSYKLNDKVIFEDKGKQICITDAGSESREAILAMVKLAREKYGDNFKLTGTAEFKAKVEQVIRQEKETLAAQQTQNRNPHDGHRKPKPN